MKIQLTENQYNSLDRIARKTGMDCWFLIRQKDGEDYVFDLEKGRKISWESALNDFIDGIVDDREFYGLSNEDVAELAELFSKFGLKLCIQDVTVEVQKRDSMQELYEKMLSELQAFRETLLKLEPADIIGNYNPYELIYKEDLLMCFEDDELCLTDNDVQLLLWMDKPLDWLYQSWCDSSVSHMDMLREFIKNTVQTQEAHN